ncbi:MAG: protein kinase [Actinomycetales bacterium]|uniref:serine/threonine-protein kinase n=1 Tax=Thermobispora bispora TaxID=2006 RepID=UPI00197D877D|nr:serine/threonine-protein kinase [Thermobispora bispora]QSI49034.1 serine/threonine protein kinase [Thermobispora bispora]
MYGHTGSWRVPGYTEIRELGTRGGGRVVLARRDADGVLVAIKYFSGELSADLRFMPRLRHEARQLAAMDPHPHIARIHDCVDSRQGAAIVMELVNGVSLRAMLRSHGPIGPEAALTVLKASLLALAAAHEIGVLHRDYKPENVLIEGDGTVKLVDFGAAPPSEPADPADAPPYRAPEQWLNGLATPASDIYAATVVFFECLTGTRPARAGGSPGQGRPIDPAADRLPPSLRRLIERGTAGRPSDRPQSAAAFAEELTEIATAGYGPEWEVRGRQRLAALAGLLDAFFPLGGEPDDRFDPLPARPRGAFARAGTRIALLCTGLAVIAGGAAMALHPGDGAGRPGAPATTATVPAVPPVPDRATADPVVAEPEVTPTPAPRTSAPASPAPPTPTPPGSTPPGPAPSARPQPSPTVPPSRTRPPASRPSAAPTKRTSPVQSRRGTGTPRPESPPADNPGSPDPVIIDRMPDVTSRPVTTAPSRPGTTPPQSPGGGSPS